MRDDGTVISCDRELQYCSTAVDAFHPSLVLLVDVVLEKDHNNCAGGVGVRIAARESQTSLLVGSGCYVHVESNQTVVGGLGYWFSLEVG